MEAVGVVMALEQERLAAPVVGCGRCVYCYLGATLNCHRVRGGEAPAAGLETVVLSVPIDPERFENAADEVMQFLKLGGFAELVGVGADFRLRLGRSLFAITLKGLLQQLVDNSERERRRLDEEVNREFDEVFGGVMELGSVDGGGEAGRG